MATATQSGAGPRELRRADIRLPGIVLGLGLGGFIDGILLHQVLQWHHMLSATDGDRLGLPYYPVDTVPGLRMNTLWDGLFHVFTWLAVLIGLALLYARVSDARRDVWGSRALWGFVLVGWGLFNVVEGLIDHHLLGIHHVRSGPNQLWWDLGFLGSGVVLMLVGWRIQRDAPIVRPAAEPRDRRG